ncbi:unnamed protein product [Rotaria sp. Silwood1]|nr:unnamed protein product [Rotaria sp. Silwood1]
MGAFLAQPTSHSHTPQSDRVPAIQLKNDMKVCAVITDEPTSSILHSALRTYPLSAAGELPSNEALMLMIRRQCTVETVDVDGRLPEKLRKTYCYEDFILHEDKNLIIFTTKTNLSILKQNKHWFADGTFKVCSNDYYQLFTLHAMMTNAIIPLVYALLIDQVITGFDLICDQFDDDADDLLDYFEKTWIGEKKEEKPQFDYKLWNVYDGVIATAPRSNNSVEGWHNAFANRVAISHPNIVKLVIT